MSILIFDVETSGLPDFNKRARDPAQPHIVQLAMLQLDESGKEIYSSSVLIKPDGWIIPDGVIRVHGITNEMASSEGIDERLAAQNFLQFMRNSSLLTAHNITFDKFMLRIACRRFDLITDADDLWWKQFPTFCTMKATTSICAIPPTEAMIATGRNWFKSPKLQESHRHCLGVEFDGAHDAMSDVRACARIYRWLQERKAKEVPA